MTERALVGICREILGGEISATTNFFDAGGDSLLALQVVARAREAGFRLTPRVLYEARSVRELAQRLEDEQPLEARWDGHPAESDSVPLTPSQLRRLDWRLERLGHYNVAWLIELDPGVDAGILAEAGAVLLRRHDALRLRFTERDGVWRQTLEPGSLDAPVDVVSLSDRSLLDRAADEAYRSIDLAHGPVFRVVLLKLDSGERYALVVVNYLVCDAYAAHVLNGDLTETYRELDAGREPSGGPRSATFRRWALAVRDYADAGGARDQLSYWTSLPWERVAGGPRDRNGVLLRAAVRRARWSLSASETSALTRAARAFGVSPGTLVAAVTAAGYARWSGGETALFDVYRHGRDPSFTHLDLSRTVGFVASVVPALLAFERTGAPQFETALSQLRRLPAEATGYGVLRHLVREPRVVALPSSENLINFRSRVWGEPRAHNVFRRVLAAPGAPIDPAERDHYTFRFEFDVVDEALHFSLGFNANRHHATSAANLAGCVRDAARLAARSPVRS